MNRSGYFSRPSSLFPRRSTGDRDDGGGVYSSSSSMGKKASSFWSSPWRKAPPQAGSTSSSSALTTANGAGRAVSSSALASRSSTTSTSTGSNHSSLPPPSSSQQREQPHQDIDANFWRFMDRVIFTRTATKDRAPLVELVEGIRAETYLLNHYGQAQIDALLAPVEAKAAYVSLKHVPAKTLQVAWVTFPEFKSMCTSPSPPTAPAPPAAAAAAPLDAAATSSITTTTTTTTSIVPMEGQVVSPKRRRANHDHQGGLALSNPTSSSTTSSSSSSSPHLSIAEGLEMNREKLLSRLQQISNEYIPQEGSQAEVDAAGAEARVEGVLAAFGARSDPMREALAAVEETLKQKTAARKEAGARDRRDRQAEMEVRMAVDASEVIVRERMAPLTEEEQEEIHRLLRQGRDTDVVVSGFNVDMRRQDIRTCAPCTWLNDEVINFFMSLLKERDNALVAAALERGEERRKNWFFNSFFISKLLDDDNGYKYANVKRWSRKAGDLFSYDKVFFPVNIGNSHWCMAVIHMQDKKIQYFDSLVGTGREYLPHLRRYLQDEHQDKKKAALDVSGWELVYSDRQVVPQQANGADCGCFASAFAYLLSEGLPIKYISQADMPAFRQRLVMSIMKKALSW